MNRSLRGVDQLAEGHVALDDHAVQRRDHVEPGPLLDELLAVGHFFADQPGGLGPHFVDFLLGKSPALQGPQGLGDRDPIGFDLSLGLAEGAVGNGPFG